MDRYAALQLFLRVVEDGSFAAAASHGGISRAQASKLIRALEDDLGVRLIQRTTRKLSLTEAGLQFHARVAEAMLALQEAAAEAAQRQTEPRGRLRVSAPTSFATRHLGDALTEFLRRHPRIELELDLSDQRADLVRDGFDMAIRIGHLADSSLVARRIAPARMMAVAAPSYLRTHGTPVHPQQLESHAGLLYTLTAHPGQWTFTHGGESVTVRLRGPLRAGNGDVLAGAALRGLGIAVQPTFIVGDAVRRGELQRILSDWELPDAAIYAVYPAGRAVPAKTRALIDFLAARYGDEPYWDEGLFAPVAARAVRGRAARARG